MKATISLVVLLLGCGQAACAKEPWAIIGSGTVTCEVFVNASRDPIAKDILARQISSWAQGWISARNAAGRNTSPLTVGGSLSADALDAMLVSECDDRPKDPVWLAVESLYGRLEAKGL